MVQRHVPFHLQSIVVILVVFGSGLALAGPYRRQYYNDWNYYPQFGYYYSSYYFQPAADMKGYKHHFCIYYPSSPRYVYYYDPDEHHYWGRLDLKGEPGRQYSLLAPKDRKDKVTDIPEQAFPKPGKMPPIPESKDGVPMEPVKVLPTIGQEGKSPSPQAK